ncbi:MAG: hypothetical protein Fur002_20560 [Anaerolineales bacterium]
MTYIPYFSTLVTFAFTAAVFTRYWRKGGAHLLLWALGLLFYGLGTLSEVVLSVSFNLLTLKIWYLTGAMLTAAWLGQGTLHLLVRKGKTAAILTGILTAVSLLSLVLVLSAPALPGAFDVARPVSEQYKDILTRSGLTIFLTIILNIYGTLTLVGGAIYSAFLFWRKKILANRMFGNVLIAAGALSPALGGTLLKAGYADMLYVSEFIGAILMFIGFVMATSGKTD